MALTEARDTRKQGQFPIAELMSVDVKAATTLFLGGIICVDATGYAVPGATATTLIAVGRSAADYDNSAGANGDLVAEIEQGIFKFANSAAADEITRTEVGKTCFIVDDETIAKTSGAGTRSIAGQVVRVDADGQVWVEMRLTLPSDVTALVADLLSTGAGSGASTVGIQDAATYYTGTEVEAALTALGVQIGGLTDAAFAFAEQNVLTDDDALYAALEKLDLKWGDLASIANAEGASLVGLEDAAGLLAAADVEAAVLELVKYASVELADPGTGVAIPVTRSATVALTTGAGAETNTLAIPAFVGQRMLLTHDVFGGGTRTVTVASAINVAGHLTMAFGAARDTIELVAIQLSGVLAWEIRFNNNVVVA